MPEEFYEGRSPIQFGDDPFVHDVHQQGMPTEVEEILFHAYPGHLQYVGPYVGEATFGFRPGGSGESVRTG
ncbi:hypothetical protein HNR25_003785 [Streptomonospora salina]|uniref:Uncharacterized protein n=1 Tax=Streptomonospora salina TaxID=104205 RepID=A0A841EC97_9ACTN|nr:hypothetical protein [Streptomonospora salina]MBB6000034.1 hypothetical protein [Streptomonospora salina]